MRLGRISYVNMAPVFYGLEADVEEVTGVPTELSRMLLAGEIDIAPIPSIEYARNADRCGSSRASASRPRARSTRSSSSRGCRSARCARSR